MQNHQTEFFNRLSDQKMNIKSGFIREDALFTEQHFYLTLNYEAVHREAFEMVAISN